MASDQTTIEQHGSEPAGTAKVAFVTGAGLGIGAASARTLARQGYRVAVVGHSLDSAREVVASIENCGCTAQRGGESENHGAGVLVELVHIAAQLRVKAVASEGRAGQHAAR